MTTLNLPFLTYAQRRAGRELGYCVPNSLADTVCAVDCCAENAS